MSVTRTPVNWVEPMIALTVALFGGLIVVATSDIDTKYRLAITAATIGFAVLVIMPERRIACVVLWLLIHPLGLEKVFFIDAAEAPLFINPTIALNISDAPLVLLGLFIFTESVFAGRAAFRWSRLTTAMLLFTTWSVISYAIHATYLGDGFTLSSPLALLQDVRLLLFILLIQSAIRSRGDIILVLLAMALAVVIQCVFIGLSYSTGQNFAYGAYTSGVALQDFSTAGNGVIVRPAGTVGQVNDQAKFHVFMTLPLITLFIVKNRWIRVAAACIIAASAIAVIVTFSRGAWVALFFGLLVFGTIGFLRRIIAKKVLLIGAGFVVAGAVALLLFAQPVYDRLTSGDDGATESRLRMLRLATDLFSSYPLLGVGPGEYSEAALRLFPPGFEENEWLPPGEIRRFPAPTIGRLDVAQTRLYNIQVRRPLPVHNKYVLILAELGLPGLILWLWFLVEFFLACWRCSRSSDKVIQLLGVALIGTAAAESVYMLFDLFIEDRPLEFILFIPAFALAASRCLAPRLPAATLGLRANSRQVW